MTPVIALHRIHRNPTRRMKATGRYDADGNMILVSDTQVVKSGDQFDTDGSELQELLEGGAVRLLTEQEVVLAGLSGHSADEAV